MGPHRGVVGATLVAAWIAFVVEPWELLPFRDERVVAPVVRDVAQGVVDFYAVFLPFEPHQNVEMHSLVLCAIFGFTLAVGLLVAARRPISAAAVTVAAVGWPATLAGWSAVAFGVAALAAALAIPLVLRASSARTFVGGVALAALVVDERRSGFLGDDARARRRSGLEHVGHPRAGSSGERRSSSSGTRTTTASTSRRRRPSS